MRTVRSARGTVYLVGAGPGDPSLLTLRAAELLRAARVVAHDALIPEPVLAMIGPDAERVAVGRRHGQGALAHRIHPAVLERARAGGDVVRLKAGDPFVFARGGEEAEALAEAGIPFQVVPGITAALGAAAYAGIPLTHRDHASDVFLATGHDADGKFVSRTAWDGVAADCGTLVLYMAARRVRENMARLMAAGRPPGTPAACVAAATRAEQRVVTGTIANLPERMADMGPGVPALILVGEVVHVRERIAWAEFCPLLGRRLVVARARPGPSAIAARLRGQGASVLEAPHFDAVPLPQAQDFTCRLATAPHTTVVFACETSVRLLAQRADGVARELARRPVVALGQAVAQQLVGAGLSPSLALDGACTDALAAHRSFWQGRAVLLPTSDRGRPHLVRELARLGAWVHPVPVYRLQAALPELPPQPGELLVLPSSTAAQALLEAAPNLRRLPAVAIGPRTAAAARARGVEQVLSARHDTPEAVIEAVRARLDATGAATFAPGPGPWTQAFARSLQAGGESR